MVNLKDRAEAIKQAKFANRSVEERYDALLSFVSQVKQKINSISSEDIEALKYIVRNDNLKIDHPVNEYFNFLVQAWCEEIFSITISQKSKSKEKVINTEKQAIATENPKVEIEHEYDPEMLKLCRVRPDEWSLDALRDDILNGDEGDK